MGAMNLLAWGLLLLSLSTSIARADVVLDPGGRTEECPAESALRDEAEVKSSSVLQRDYSTKKVVAPVSGQPQPVLPPAVSAAVQLTPPPPTPVPPPTSFWHTYLFLATLLAGSMLHAIKLPSFAPLVQKSLTASGKSQHVPNKDSIKGTTAQDSALTTNVGMLEHDPPAVASCLLELLPDIEATAMCQDGADPAPVSYRELRGLLERPEAAGVSGCFLKSDRVALVLDNGKDMAVCMLAVMHMACAVPLNSGFTEKELLAAMQQLKCSVVLLRPGQAGEAARKAAEQLGLRILTLQKQIAPGRLLSLEGPRVEPDGSKESVEASSNDRVVLLLKTSGTTSKGKVVTFTMGRLSLAARYNASSVDLGQGSVCLSMMPLYHIAGISVNFLASMSAGANVLFYSGAFEVERFAAELERPDSYKPTWYFAVPAVHDAVLSYVAELGRPLKHQLRLIRSAGAALLQQTGLRLVDVFGCAVTPAYGMTEALEITCPPDNYRLERPGSVGPSISADIILVAGEVCIRGNLVMPGYEFNGPQEEDPNAEAWTTGDAKGFLRTGDLGHLDKDGWLYLTGRSKEMINRGGETINPHEVEPALASKPGIEVVVCFSAPHHALGECVAAAVVLNKGMEVQEVSPEQILQHCAPMLSGIMQPEVFVYVPRDVLPTTATKKFIRAGLAQRLGLTSDMMSSGASVFVYNPAKGMIEPRDDLQSRTVMVKDSLGHLRETSGKEATEQRLKDGLFGLGIIQVVTKHWYEGNYADVPLPSWFIPVYTKWACSAMMFMALFFLLTGHSLAQISTRKQLRERWLGLYVVMMAASYIGLATNSLIVHWYFAWLLLAELSVTGIDIMCLRLPEAMGDLRRALSASTSICIFLLCAAFTNTEIPEGFCVAAGHTLDMSAGWSLGGSRSTWGNMFLATLDWCLGEWSFGLLFIWAVSFAIGFHLLPSLSKALWARPGLLSVLAKPEVRMLSCAAVVLLIGVSPGWPNSVEGWWWPWGPRGSSGLEPLMDLSACLVSMLHTYVSIACMAVAVGPNARILQDVGKYAIGTLITHTSFSRYTLILYNIDGKWWGFHDALELGVFASSPTAVVIAMVVIPFLYVYSIGRLAQGLVDMMLSNAMNSAVLLWACYLTAVNWPS